MLVERAASIGAPSRDFLALPDFQVPRLDGLPQEAHQLAAQRIISVHCGEIRAMAPVANGRINWVFIADTKDRGLVTVKMREVGESEEPYQRAARAIELARAVGLPVPRTLFTGSFNGYPYLINTYKEGIPANIYDGDKADVWYQLGEYARELHEVTMSNVSPDFDIISAQPVPHATLNGYIEGELSKSLRPHYRDQWQILTGGEYEKMAATLKRLQDVRFDSRLVHRDLVLRNVKVDQTGRVTAILDWDNASFHMVPQYELALAFEYKPNEDEGLEAFLKGYGISPEEYFDMQSLVTDFRCLEYLRRLMDKIDRGKLEEARMDEQMLMSFLYPDLSLQ